MEMIRTKKGFSLIEVLIAIGIFAVISVVSLDLFLASVKSSNKTRIVSQVTQDGKQISTILESMIRNATHVKLCYWNDQSGHGSGCGPGDNDDNCLLSTTITCNQMILTDNDGLTWKIDYYPAVDVNGCGADHNRPLDGSHCDNFDNTNKVSNGYMVIKDSEGAFNLSDTNPVSGVDVRCPCEYGGEAGGFQMMDKLPDSTAPNSIFFRFVIDQGVKAPSRQDFQAGVTEERAVSLRSSL